MSEKPASQILRMFAFGIFGLIMSCGTTTNKDTAPTPDWVLTWHDEFEGEAGTPPNPENWVYDVGGEGWGNNQLEFDTDRPENVSLDGAGHLAIVARKELFQGREYTGARIKTKDLFEQRYGRIEARIKLPIGRGIWPAFWMLGNDIDDNEWPGCGEIDIMEYRGQEPRIVHGTIHGPGYSAGEAITSSYRLPDDETFADDFHVFAVDWDPSRFTFWVDDQVYHVINADEVTARGPWVFEHPHFLLLNVAVGGGFVGAPDASTEFPQTMLVDWVRVYSRAR
jgi:beta-glucanase (GH16 family)